MAVMTLASVLCMSCGGGKKTQQEKKVIALTFDDGPNLSTSMQVLDKLEQYGVVASFFLEGQYITPETESVMKREVELGCEINNHSNTHQYMAQLSEQEIADEIEITQSKIESVIGKRPVFFRPPYINVNDLMHQTIGLTFICGVGCEDWVAEVSAQQRAERVIANAADGQIILMHDFVGNDNTVAALDSIIPALLDQGYEFVTVSQLFERKGITPEPHDGIVYSYTDQKARNQVAE